MSLLQAIRVAFAIAIAIVPAREDRGIIVSEVEVREHRDHDIKSVVSIVQQGSTCKPELRMMQLHTRAMPRICIHSTPYRLQSQLQLQLQLQARTRALAAGREHGGLVHRI